MLLTRFKILHEGLGNHVRSTTSFGHQFSPYRQFWYKILINRHWWIFSVDIYDLGKKPAKYVQKRSGKREMKKERWPPQHPCAMYPYSLLWKKSLYAIIAIRMPTGVSIGSKTKRNACWKRPTMEGWNAIYIDKGKRSDKCPMWSINMYSCVVDYCPAFHACS